MKKKLTNIKKHSAGGRYVVSGLLMTFTSLITGFIVLSWIKPEELGRWQSYTVFIGYVQLLALGIPQGINRELPYWLGKDRIDTALAKLKTAGAFINKLVVALYVVLTIVAIVLYTTKTIEKEGLAMLMFAGSLAFFNIQRSFLGATYRTSKEFAKLTNIQLAISALYVLLIPLIYVFDIWGYVAYQFVINGVFVILFKIYRPYKIKYNFNKEDFIDLFKVGFPIFFWNYIGVISRSVPRLVLVIFGSPLLVGLFAPAANINNAVLAIPKFLNRYLFPKMTFKFGQDGNKENVFKTALQTVKYLFLVMLGVGLVLVFLLPYAIPIVFPKYKDGILAAQIMVFSGVFYSVNTVFHVALNSLKEFKFFKYLISFRLFSLLICSYVFVTIYDDLLLGVSIAAAVTECINMFNYYVFLKKAKRN
ncbi:hypothetical protein BWZ20_06325 [Winogradskyella sp. J14-2]|uniref:lipopolysaccharide biosynthesis protein n=1 Tax=Winogradskyella sp. J14-2 TaxID=1936080 RepID=UPI000972AE55|nr:hypothetical protein [Winogradskyella sp. J14-2]APY07941.1 hypothetical protein BWZ20_06325 [Winogradskyella sp. J14-2]